MMVVFVEMALITPPVGMVLFVVKSISDDIKMEKLFLSVVPYVATILVFVFILFFFPDIVTWLPSHMK
jgi:TRAP-type C4-dicarboxylate transport system permease large subunit